jgi:asparagine N-glycosylation enzyme membrane subunit Stt3
MATKKYNFTFFQDLLRERRGGKYSSKKIWGFIFMTLVSISYILDGLKFYKVSVDLFNSVLTAGTILIGAGVLNLFSKKTDKDLKPDE